MSDKWIEHWRGSTDESEGLLAHFANFHYILFFWLDSKIRGIPARRKGGFGKKEVFDERCTWKNVSCHPTHHIYF